MSEQAPHTSAKCHCVSRGAPLEGMPNEDWIFRVGTDKKRAHLHRSYVQFCLQQIESTQSPCSKRELTTAYKAAYGTSRNISNFVPKTSWLAHHNAVTLWPASNVRVLHASRQMRTLRSGWRQMQPLIEQSDSPLPPKKVLHLRKSEILKQCRGTMSWFA